MIMLVLGKQQILLLVMLVALQLCSSCVQAFRSNPGFKEFSLGKPVDYISFSKSLYSNAEIRVTINAQQEQKVKYKLSWLLRRSPCAEEYASAEGQFNREQSYFINPQGLQYKELTYKTVEYIKYNNSACGSVLVLPLVTDSPIVKNAAAIGAKPIADGKFSNSAASSSKNRTRQRRAESGKASPTTEQSTVGAAKAGEHDKNGLVVKAWQDGIYLFVLRFERCDATEQSQNNPTTTTSSAGSAAAAAAAAPVLTGSISIRNTIGYLSAIDWPLLPFYGSMCLLYIMFGILWLIFSARYWREMLRIQFCISGVIFLGMLEKAVFYAEYQSINSSGYSVRGAVMFAELVSCVKRSVARMLVLIVCLGYGIVKPRLGNLQHKVIAIGLVYFIFATVEGSLRSMRPRFDPSRNLFYATIPLAITDAVICWWIFSSLVQTVRNLRLRRNLVKLSLYRHFTNTLVFCVVSSVIFMGWTIGRHKFAVCITAWRELWVDEAFWHLLFCVILFVIIILWRPSQNNQRYAFTPLLDVGDESDDDEDNGEDVVMDNLAEGVKSRHSSGRGANSQQQKQQQQQQQQQRQGQGARGADDDLKWVEDNIPQSLVESTLPTLLQDSDEEILTTKYEMSKME